MHNFEDDIFGNEPTLPSVEEPIVEPSVVHDPGPTTQTDPLNLGDPEPEKSSVLDKFLESRGIKDSKIPITEEGSDEEAFVNFSELSDEEKLDVLNSISIQNTNTDLDNEEIEFLNALRESKQSPKDFLEAYKEGVLQDIDNSPSYEVDSYDDKELFLLDLKNKYDLTDEELGVELQKELQNKELFSKKVAALRAEYKELEKQNKAYQEEAFQRKQQEEYNTFYNNMLEVAQNTEGFHGLDLEDSEKDAVLRYMLELDENGESQFNRDTRSFDKLYEMAWYARYGKDAFKAIETAYEQEIARLKKAKDEPEVVRRKNDTHDYNSEFF